MSVQHTGKSMGGIKVSFVTQGSVFQAKQPSCTAPCSSENSCIQASNAELHQKAAECSQNPAWLQPQGPLQKWEVPGADLSIRGVHWGRPLQKVARKALYVFCNLSGGYLKDLCRACIFFFSNSELSQKGCRHCLKVLQAKLTTCRYLGQKITNKTHNRPCKAQEKKLGRDSLGN